MGSNGLKELCASHRENELERLVNLVADHYNFTQAETDEALENAMLDKNRAIICFESLARQENNYEDKVEDD